MSVILNAFQTVKPKSQPGKVVIKGVKGGLLGSNGRTMGKLEPNKNMNLGSLAANSASDTIARRMDFERKEQVSKLLGKTRWRPK